MKIRWMKIAAITFMVMHFLADVRVDIRRQDPEEFLEENDLTEEELNTLKTNNFFEFLGMLMKTWIRSVRSIFKAKAEEI